MLMNICIGFMTRFSVNWKCCGHKLVRIKQSGERGFRAVVSASRSLAKMRYLVEGGSALARTAELHGVMGRSLSYSHCHLRVHVSYYLWSHTETGHCLSPTSFQVFVPETVQM